MSCVRMWERGWSFIKKAGTVILLSAVVLWFLQGFGVADGSFGMVEDLSDSYSGRHRLRPGLDLHPTGWGDWQSALWRPVTGLDG